MERSDQLRVLVYCRIPTNFSQVLTLLTYAGGVRFESQPEGFLRIQEVSFFSLKQKTLSYAGGVRFESQPEGF